MSKAKEPGLLEFYTQLLRTSSHVVDDQYQVMVALTDKHIPAQVSGKTLVLPADRLLRNPDSENQIFFHPLSEQMTRGESEVFQYLQRAMLLKLTTSFATIGFGLLKLQEDTNLQRKMTFDQVDLIKGISDADKTSSINWLKMCMAQITSAPDRIDTWPLSIYIRRNGKFEGKSYRRVAITSFPLFERIFREDRFTKGQGNDEKDLYRNKDYPMFGQVAKAIFSNIDLPLSDDYNNGYDGSLAPYLICFLRSVKLIGERLNQILNVMAEPFSGIEFDVAKARIDLSWSEVIDDVNTEVLSKMARSVPALNGNVGISTDGLEEKVEAVLVKEAPRKEVPRQEPRVEKPVVRQEPIEVSQQEASSDIGLNQEQRRLRDEAIKRRKDFEMEEERWRIENLEREARRKQDEEDRRNRSRDYDREQESRRVPLSSSRDRDLDRGRDDRDLDRAPSIINSNGKVNFGALLEEKPSISRGTRTEEEENDRGYGRGGRSRYDRDDRDDRPYRGRGGRGDPRDDRDYRGGGSYDRGGRDYYDRGRDDRDDRSYRGRDRGYGRR